MTAKVRSRSRQTAKPTTVKVGSAVVKIYRTINRGRVLHTVSYYSAGQPRQRLNFADLATAKTEAQKIATRISNGEVEVLKLRSHDRGVYLASVEALRDTGRSMDLAAQEYATAFKILEGRGTVVEAAEFFVKHRAPGVKPGAVPELVEQFITAKKSDGVSTRYLEDCRARLRAFARDFAGTIDNITTGQLGEWLRSLTVSGRTRNNFRRLLITFFLDARNRGFLPKHLPTAAEDLTLAREASRKIILLNPQETAKLLLDAEPDILVYLGIAGFAGIRRQEVLRLSWNDVDLNEGHIQVGSDKAKTASRRLVPIQPNLRDWLSPHIRSGRAICRSTHVPSDAIEYAESLGIKWFSNMLRDSYASYRLAIVKNAPQVALEMGNSPEKVFRNYRELVTEARAHLWWSIAPSNAKAISEGLIIR